MLDYYNNIVYNRYVEQKGVTNETRINYQSIDRII